MNFIYALYAGLVAGAPPKSPPSLLNTPEIGSREPMTPPLYEKRRVSPSKTHLGTQFGQGTFLSRIKQ